MKNALSLCDVRDNGLGRTEHSIVVSKSYLLVRSCRLLRNININNIQYYGDNVGFIDPDVVENSFVEEPNSNLPEVNLPEVVSHFGLIHVI